MQTNLPIPDFSLPDHTGQVHKLSAYRGRVVLVNFWSAECPWSERADGQLTNLLTRFPGKIALLPVASNLNETIQMIGQTIPQRGLDFVLIDRHCELADGWNAQTTPHVFVIDPHGVLRYQGAVDDVTFRKRLPQQFYVEQAVTALLSGRLPEIQETPVYGCTIVRNE